MKKERIGGEWKDNDVVPKINKNLRNSSSS